jgi:hypothetical protein
LRSQQFLQRYRDNSGCCDNTIDATGSYARCTDNHGTDACEAGARETGARAAAGALAGTDAGLDTGHSIK